MQEKQHSCARATFDGSLLLVFVYRILTVYNTSYDP
jgi:hypothetical protein